MTCPTCNEGICTQDCATGTKPRRANQRTANKNRPAMQHFNRTALMLMMQHNGPVIPLSAVADLLGFKTPEAATKAANAGELMLSPFKLRDSQKAPWLIHVEDLARYVDQQREQATHETASYSAPVRRAA